MIRWLFIRVLLPLFVILIVRSVIMAIAKSFSAVMHQPAQPDAESGGRFPSGGELKKDPVCGTYVSPGAADHQARR